MGKKEHGQAKAREKAKIVEDMRRRMLRCSELSVLCKYLRNKIQPRAVTRAR